MVGDAYMSFNTKVMVEERFKVLKFEPTMDA